MTDASNRSMLLPLLATMVVLSSVASFPAPAKADGDPWNSYAPTESWNSYVPTENWYSYAPTDTWNSYAPSENWNSYAPTEDWNSYTPTTVNPDTWNSYAPSENWNSYAPTEDWNSYTPTTVNPDTWNSYAPSENWNSYAPTEDWNSYTPTTVNPDTWNSYAPSENWNSYAPTEDWNSYTPTTINPDTWNSYAPVEGEWEPTGEMRSSVSYYGREPVYAVDYFGQYYAGRPSGGYSYGGYGGSYGGGYAYQPVYAHDYFREFTPSRSTYTDNSYVDNSVVDNSYVDNSYTDNSYYSDDDYTEYNHNYQGYDACSTIPGDQPSGYDCTPDQHDAQPVCAISASDSHLDEGDSTTLHWTSERATSATLTDFGSVSTGGSKSVSPNNDKTYVLTVRDNDGDEATCSTRITVEDDEEEDDEPWCRLEASDTRVEEGDRITLEWDTRNAERATLNHGIGRVDEDGGEERVTIDDNDDITFRMTVEDDDGDEDTCSVTIRVDEEREYSTVVYDDEPANNPPVVYLSDIPYTGLEDIDPALLSFIVLVTALAGAGAFMAVRAGIVPTFAFASAEPTDEGHAQEAEGHADTAVEATPAALAFLSALSEGDTNGAVDVLRFAAASGEGVEETLESAAAAAPDTLKGAIDRALAASRETGIRGAKDALGA